MIKLSLAAAFFTTALLYSMVGFGGGSTYTALLAVSGTPFILIPVVSLACNIVVVSGNTVRFSRAGWVRWSRLISILVLSVPAAWLGGRLVVSEAVFIGLLCVALAIGGGRLLLARPPQNGAVRILPRWAGSVLGAGVGFYSGIVGIGGGIFLAPILHALNWGRAREISAACSVFILVNSLAGLAGQLSKLESAVPAFDYWPLLVAVMAGGWIGNRLTLSRISPELLRRMTGGLILLVAVRLAVRWIGLMA